MKLAKKYPVLGSSADPEKLAMTIKGAALALIPIVIVILKAVGVELADTDLVSLIEAISAAVAAVMIVYGIGRKIYKKVKSWQFCLLLLTLKEKEF